MASVLSGAVVILAAIIGIDCAVTASAGRQHKSTAVVAHAVAPSRPGLLSVGASLTWTAATLLMLVVLRRSPAFVSGAAVEREADPGAYTTWALYSLLRKFSISYRSGGRYGP